MRYHCDTATKRSETAAVQFTLVDKFQRWIQVLIIWYGVSLTRRSLHEYMSCRTSQSVGGKLVNIKLTGIFAWLLGTDGSRVPSRKELIKLHIPIGSVTVNVTDTSDRQTGGHFIIRFIAFCVPYNIRKNYRQSRSTRLIFGAGTASDNYPSLSKMQSAEEYPFTERRKFYKLVAQFSGFFFDYCLERLISFRG